ncbi:oligosaccharide repeat unit polymerase [Candidatus Uhrbacteria bacterium]|nr:oligosaccharide repeat unit polymerase [Candidatus Uhrbacteria bacterium]
MWTIARRSVVKGAIVALGLLLSLRALLELEADAFLQCVVVVISAFPFVRAAIAREDFFSPIIIFSALFGTSFGVVPLLQRGGWVMVDPAYAHVASEFSVRASLLSIVAILLVYVAYYEGRVAEVIVRALPMLRSTINVARTKLVVVVLFLVSGSALLMVMRQIQVHDFTEYFIYSNVSAYGRGHLAFFATLYQVAGFIALMGMWSPQARRRRFFVLAFVLALIPALLSRARGQVVLLMMVWLVFVNYRVRRWDLLQMTGVMAVVLVFSFFMAQYRGAQHFAATKENVAETFGGLFTEHQATAALLSVYATTDAPRYYGRIAMEDTVLSLIPRKLWSTKPERYGSVLVTDLIVPNRQHGYYYTIGPFGAAYADFGYVGVCISMLAIGFFMRVAYAFLRRNVHHDGVVLWYGLFCFTLWAFVRGGFGFMPVFMSNSILAIVLYVVVANIVTLQPRSMLRGRLLVSRPA